MESSLGIALSLSHHREVEVTVELVGAFSRVLDHLVARDQLELGRAPDQGEEAFLVRQEEHRLLVVDDPGSLIRQTTADELDALMADGTIAGGMIPKVESCVQAVRNGVRRAHILDGRIPHVLLLEIFTDAGIGTMVSGGS